MASIFPRQDVSEAEKNKDGKQWYKDAVDYGADSYCTSYSTRWSRIEKNQNGYNGVITANEFDFLNNAYGGENKAKYIDYRLCRSQIDNLGGEQLIIPLNGHVYVTNPEAKSKILDEISVPVGMHYVQDKIKALREKVGVDVFNGMQPPQVPDGKTIFDTLSTKSKAEVTMQTIMDLQIEEMKLKIQLHNNFIDTVLNSECFGKVYIDSDGNVKMRAIPIENAIFDESQGDNFGDNSPGLGERREMFYHEILKEFNLTKEQANELREMQTNVPSCDHQGINYPRINGAQAYSVYTYEWIGLQAERMKVWKDKVTGEDRETLFSSEYYEKNEKKIERERKNGKYEVVTKYKFVLYEATRIGHNMYVNMGPVQYMPTDLSHPAWTMRRYVLLLYGTVGGVRVSIKQLTEHIDRTYNMIMFQINRELAKAKGRVIGVDLAALKKGTTQKQALYNITNEGVIFFNSAEEGNEGNKSFEQQIGIGAVDLGVSATINTLIPLKVDLEQTAERITGIFKSRMGQIAASATVSNTQASVQNSRTTTAALFYFFGNYIERIMRLTLEFSKISWGILKPEQGEVYLGTEKFQFLKSTEEIAFQSYGYRMADITKEQNVRDILRQLYPVILNSTPEMAPDILQAELANTGTEATAVIRAAFKRINDMRQEEARAAEAAAAQREMIAAQGPIDVQAEKNKGDLLKVAAKANADTVMEGQKAANQAVLQRNQAQHQEKEVRK